MLCLLHVISLCKLRKNHLVVETTKRDAIVAISDLFLYEFRDAKPFWDQMKLCNEMHAQQKVVDLII